MVLVGWWVGAVLREDFLPRTGTGMRPRSNLAPTNNQRICNLLDLNLGSLTPLHLPWNITLSQRRNEKMKESD